MKKIYLIISTISLAFFLSACGGGDTTIGKKKSLDDINSSLNKEDIENNITIINKENNITDSIDKNTSDTKDEQANIDTGNTIPVSEDTVLAVDNTAVSSVNVVVSANNTSSSISLQIADCENYTIILAGDIVNKDVENTTVKIVDSDSNKKICVVIGKAHIQRGE